MIADKELVSVDAGLMRRLVRAAEKVEAWTRGGGGPGRGSQWTPSVVRAYVTTAIPTGTLASPSSSGRAKLYAFDGTSWYDTGTEVTVWNDNTMTASVGSPRVVKLAWIAGQWWLVAASCS